MDESYCRACHQSAILPATHHRVLSRMKILPLRCHPRRMPTGSDKDSDSAYTHDWPVNDEKRNRIKAYCKHVTSENEIYAEHNARYCTLSTTNAMLHVHSSIHVDIGLRIGTRLPIESQRIQLRLVVDAVQVYSFPTIGKVLVFVPCRNAERVPLFP
jgi:hypothetical protein